MITKQQLDQLNTNGWSWVLVSNLTPNVIRIRLAVNNDPMAGKSITGSSFEECLMHAQEFVESVAVEDYVETYYDILRYAYGSL